MSRSSGGEDRTLAPFWFASVSVTIALLVWTALPLASPGPTVLLYGAILEQARHFAIDSALDRGWRLVSATAESVTFEQTLAEDPEKEGSTPLRVIRVLARFSQEGDGVRIQLTAQEVESPGQAEESAADVTDRYGLNLANALSSLRARWDAHRSTTPAPQLTDRASDGFRDGFNDVPQRRDPTPANLDRDESPGRVGTWAYYAERYAQSRGCVLADSGARLESAGAEWECHRVPCQDGSWLRVYCRFGDCTTTPP